MMRKWVRMITMHVASPDAKRQPIWLLVQKSATSFSDGVKKVSAWSVVRSLVAKWMLRVTGAAEIPESEPETFY